MDDHAPDALVPPRVATAAAPERWWVRRAVAAMAGVCAVLVAVTAVPPLVALPLRVSGDYGEGWNAYWALAAVRGQPLYSGAHVLVADNYPPLSFYAVGLLGLVVGDPIVAGRMVATAATVAVALLIVRILVRCGVPGRWAALFALLFGLYDLLFFRTFVAVDNPQWLAEAIMLAAVTPLLRRRPGAAGWRALAGSAALIVLAGLVKHNLFALPLAVTGWLLVVDRAALLVWAGSGAGLALLGCAGLWLGYGGAAFTEILGFARSFSSGTFRSALTTTSSLSALIAVGALGVLRAGRERAAPNRPILLFALFAGFGVLSGLGQRLGNGVSVNAQFDALIGLVILCGLAVGRDARGAARAALLLVLLVPPLLAAPRRVERAGGELAALPRERAAWARLIAAVHDAPGPVLCEYLAACVWAGKPEVVDFFSYGEKLRAGRDPGGLAALVAARRAAMIVRDRPGSHLPGGERLPPPLPALIGANYRVVAFGPGAMEVMVPAGAPSR